MARSLNLCQFIGNLGKDVETRFTQGGKAVANFSIAVADGYKDKQTGENVDQTEWVRCVAFDKLAEICGQYLHKGSKVYVQGRMKTRSYDKNGVTHYATEIVLDTMQMLSSSEVPREQHQTQQSPQSDDFFDDSAIPF